MFHQPTAVLPLRVSSAYSSVAVAVFACFISRRGQKEAAFWWQGLLPPQKRVSAAMSAGGKHLSTLCKGKHLSTLCKGFCGRSAVFMLRQVSVEQFAPQTFAIDIRQYNGRAGCGLDTATTAVMLTRPRQLWS